MKRRRRFAMGIETLLGLRRRGVFIPYRYAEGVPRPPDAPGYPAVEALFRASEGRFEETLELIDAEAAALAALGGPAPEPRFDQDWFPRLDGAAAYALVKARRPARIVEVGSGHSTRFMARAARDAGLTTRILCLDPAPRATLPPGVEHRAELLSSAHAALFEALRAGDMAVFDSSHILFPHTDVDLILTTILPALAEGVLAHVHDIFLPDPYPAAWGWRGYGEQVGLAPWLLSGAFRPIHSSRWAATRLGAAERRGLRELPLAPDVFESSLWMEKTGAAA